MKEGWEIKKLGDICETSSGGTPSKSHPEYYEDGNIPWLRSGEISQGHIYETELYITEEGLNKSSAKIFPIDTVVIAMYGATVGQVGILKKEMSTNQAVCGIFPTSMLSPLFLVYYLKAKKPYFLTLAAGGAQPNISQNIIKSTPIPVPSIAEQEKIVAELDCLSGIIEKKKQQLKEYDALAQSIFYEMFDKSSEFVALSFYIDSLSAGKSLAGDEECPNKVLKTGAVTYDYFDSKQVKNLPLEYIPIQNHKVNVKDVLISRMNTAELVGACAYVWNVDDSTYLPDRLWRAELKNNSNPIYIWKAITTEKSKEQIRNYASGTSGSMKNISKSSFLKVQIPKVDLSLQQSFASKIEAIEKQKALIKKSIEDVETLFNSKMEYYFN